MSDLESDGPRWGGPQWGGPQWDEVVDVICIGDGPGVLAYAICCIAADLDVIIVESPTDPIDGITQFMAAMTEDLDEYADSAILPVCCARNCTVDSVEGMRPRLEPFVGEHLRQWSSQCLASPTGVLFTQVPDLLTPTATDDGTATAAVLGAYRPPLGDWLREQVSPAQERLAALVFHEGRIAGVELADGSRVGATGGLALPVGASPSDWPTDQIDADVALVGRPAGRFARIELLRR